MFLRIPDVLTPAETFRVGELPRVRSMVRGDGRRALIFDLDTGIQRLAAAHPNLPSAVMPTGVYHNLLRQWAQI